MSTSTTGTSAKLDDLKSFLSTKEPFVSLNGEEPDFVVVEVGYIEPGHGTKGRKQCLLNDEDVREPSIPWSS